ncbi:MAG: hypothetical protein ACYDG5_01540 [Dehalococcoidales bacterium]
MGFFSYVKNFFVGEGIDSEKLDAARKRHGVVITDEEKAAALKETTEAERFAKEYDVWEELDNYRWSFLVGGWVAKKLHPVGEDKVRRDLAKLEKTRREAEEKKKGED